MSIITIIFRPVIAFALVASFSLVFMQLFFVVGILTTKIQRDVIDETGEAKHFHDYMITAMGGLITGCISLAAMTFIR